VDCLSVYFYDTVLLLAACAPYGAGDFTEPLAHITNTARQAAAPGYSAGEGVHLLDDLAAEIGPAAVQQALDSMRTLTGELFRAFKGEFAGMLALLLMHSCYIHTGTS
jgi:hypothetical protein